MLLNAFFLCFRTICLPSLCSHFGSNHSRSNHFGQRLQRQVAGAAPRGGGSRSAAPRFRQSWPWEALAMTTFVRIAMVEATVDTPPMDCATPYALKEKPTAWTSYSRDLIQGRRSSDRHSRWYSLYAPRKGQGTHREYLSSSTISARGFLNFSSNRRDSHRPVSVARRCKRRRRICRRQRTRRPAVAGVLQRPAVAGVLANAGASAPQHHNFHHQ